MLAGTAESRNSEPIRGRRQTGRMPAATLQKRHNHFKKMRSLRPIQKSHCYNRCIRSRDDFEGVVLPVASRFPASADQKLIQIVDASLQDALRQSGDWLACRPGCTQCCIGVFAINQLDALRLRRGLRELEKKSPDRADAVRARARESVARLSADFPGDPATGILDESEDAAARFEDFANGETCPALDSATGLCELYESRPMTCRVFGPPVRSEDGLGVCELCFQGASDEQIAACEMTPDPEDLESQLLRRLEKSSGVRGDTIIAFALSS